MRAPSASLSNRLFQESLNEATLSWREVCVDMIPDDGF